jgi:hypothetical protein
LRTAIIINDVEKGTIIMLARVFGVSVKPGGLDELTSGVREVVRTAAKQQPGFKC